MLEIKDLHVKLEEEDKQILKGVNLTVEAGKVHAIMGPNGSGKSTLSYVLSGKGGYEVTDGSATLDGDELLDLEAEERAAAGLFLAFQYPVEIPGVGNMTFLRTAVNAQRKARGTLALLLLRGLAAGLLVAVVTVASDWLGPVWAGLLITYPIGLTVISVTIHQRSGADMAVATLQAVMTGIGSLAAFAFTLAVLLEPLGPTNAFVAATLASLLLTVVLIYGSARPIAR